MPSQKPTEERIRDFLKTSNIAPFPHRPPRTWRWQDVAERPVEVVLPDDAKGYERERELVCKAIEVVNFRLRLPLLEAVAAPSPDPRGHIKVSFGTSYIGGYQGKGCERRGTVSMTEHDGTQLEPGAGQRFAARPIVYLHLGVDSMKEHIDKCCRIDLEVVVHELGHALGLREHFMGFGADNGPAISRDFWDVLATLYGNGHGTPVEKVVPVRARLGWLPLPLVSWLAR